MNALARAERDDHQSMSLELPANQSFEEWSDTGRNLASANKVLQWWIGDWWSAGSHRYGDRAKVAAQGLFGREFGSLANMASVCRAFETSRRREHLSFSHHQEVAALSPAKADELLDRASREGWSTRDLRVEVMLVRDRQTPRWFERSGPKDFDREQAKEKIFDHIDQAATLGIICPTADELAEVSGVGSVSTTVALMHVLERENRIEVRRYQRSREVTIVATGKSTAEAANKTPHWRDATHLPTISAQTLHERLPDAAAAITNEAQRMGKNLADFQAYLIGLGWEVHQEMQRDSIGETAWAR